MQKHTRLTLDRLKMFASDPRYLRSKIYSQQMPVTLQAYAAPDRITYDEAMRGTYAPVEIGYQFGPAWSTHWVRVELTIPQAWAGREVHLLWDSSSEACVWQDGLPMQGLAGTAGSSWMPRGPYHYTYTLAKPAQGGEQMTLYLEVACNGWFGIPPNYNPVDSQIGLLRQAEIAAFDREAWDLLWDFVVVSEMAEHLSQETPRAGQALYAANEMVNAIDLNDRKTWAGARKIAADFFAAENGDGQHNVSAIGHAHIDTAWLWPLAETQRKCYRTFSTVLRYMDEYPDYKFSWSQVQQYVWIKEMFPAMYEQVKQRIKEGRIVPVGGSWVEPDCNVPSGEALARQFLYGQRFFRQEFGITCEEFWLPDTFGYPAVLPQLMRGAGIKYFLTQKLSWNQFNKPVHSTFIWEGQDGSQVLVHFPPADTYNAVATVQEVLHSVRNFKNHERSNESYYLFGYGDGGGGPTTEMLERLARMEDVDGLPRIQQRTSLEFFRRCEADAKDLFVWVGELYFELHRGTYTTQARNKRNNRKSEFLLHDVEFLAALAHAQDKAAYPHGDIDWMWQIVLLNQFHDILPGSSITEVYRDSDAHYAEVKACGEQLRSTVLDALFPQGDRVAVINTLGAPRAEVTELPDGKLGIVSAPACGYAVYETAGVATTPPQGPVTVSEAGGSILLENAFVRAVFGKDGRLTSFYDKERQREAIVPGEKGNHFVLFDDTPHNWDAWDVDVYHLEKAAAVPAASAARVVENNLLRASVEFEYAFGSSTLKQTVTLTCLSPRLDFVNEADWHEKRQFLKVEFPFDIRAENATYEMQFSYVQRPTHFNTSYDLARFEVPAHRWADLSEPGFGVALLNDSKYGYGTRRNVMRLSLLRGPEWPDPQADEGRHEFSYALLPHNGDFRAAGVIEEGYRFNVPLLVRSVQASRGETSFFSVNCPSVVIDTVKKAEDSDALIVRLYESHGGRCAVRLSSPLPVKEAGLVNLLEDDLESLAWENGGVSFDILPFQLVSVKLTLG